MGAFGVDGGAWARDGDGAVCMRDTHTQVEERRAEISKQAALVAVETSLSAQVGELRQSAEAAWRGEQDTALLRAQAVSVLEEALERARDTQDTEELREVVLQAVRTTTNELWRVRCGGVGGACTLCMAWGAAPHCSYGFVVHAVHVLECGVSLGALRE